MSLTSSDDKVIDPPLKSLNWIGRVILRGPPGRRLMQNIVPPRRALTEARRPRLISPSVLVTSAPHMDQMPNVITIVDKVDFHMSRLLIHEATAASGMNMARRSHRVGLFLIPSSIT